MADDQRTPAPLEALYDEDFYVWTQDQEAAILAAAEKEALPATIDWKRLAEEVGDLGRRDLRGAKSLTRRIIEHLWLLESSQRVEPKRHWRQEVWSFQADLALELTPTIRRLIEEDLENLHRRAAKLAAGKLELDEPGAPPLDATRRWPLAVILSEDED